MQTRLPLLLTVVLFSCPRGFATAGPPGSAATWRAKQKATSYVSIARQRTGQRALVINYPWKVHEQPSVEVRLVTGEDADPRGIRPLFFVKEYLKGEVRLKVYHAQDEAARGGATTPITKNNIDFEILGRSNSLDKPAVCVAHRVPGDDPTPGAAVVFCLLPSWAVNKGLLYLDLPREYFAKPGKMHVWFLRGEKVLWEEKVEWPGYAKPIAN